MFVLREQWPHRQLALQWAMEGSARVLTICIQCGGIAALGHGVSAVACDAAREQQTWQSRILLAVRTNRGAISARKARSRGDMLATADSVRPPTTSTSFQENNTTAAAAAAAAAASLQQQQQQQ